MPPTQPPGGPAPVAKGRDVRTGLPGRLYWLLAVAWLGFVAWRVSGMGLAAWDEARHVLSAYEMAAGGGWLAKTFGGELDLTDRKPPMIEWLVALSIRLFGYSELVARLPSLLLGMGTVTLVYLLLVRLTQEPLIAAASALGLATTTGFYGFHAMTAAEPDMPLTFFNTVSLIAVQRVFVGGSPRWHLLLGASLGLGFLSKSFVGLIPAAFIVPGFILNPDHRLLLNRHAALGLGTALLAALPWLLAREFGYPDSYLRDMLSAEIVGRTLGAVDRHGWGSFAYLIVARERLGPWRHLAGLAALLVANAPLMAAGAERRQVLEGAAFRTAALCLASAVVYLVLFSLARTKLEWYLLPAYPPLFILTGLAFSEFSGFFSPWLRRGALLVLLAANLLELRAYDAERLIPSLWTGPALDRVIMPHRAALRDKGVIAHGTLRQNELATLRIYSGLRTRAFAQESTLAEMLRACPEAQFLYAADARPFLEARRAPGAPELEPLALLEAGPTEARPGLFRIERREP